MSETAVSPLLRQVGAIARRAAEAILAIYAEEFDVQRKADASPVTAADLAAQRVIVAGLAELPESLPVLSEEARIAPWAQRRAWSRYWLVDPLDGTREFIKRNGEFSVNIALIDQHEPVLGVVLAPVGGDLYVAERGSGAWRQAQADAAWQPIATRPLAQPAVVAGSRSYGHRGAALLHELLGDDFLEAPMGSSLKFCLLARGAADVYLRRGATSEWDTAAAQCVLEEAGGAVLDLAGRPLRYNRQDSLINPEFLAVGDLTVDWTAKLKAADVDA
jgi:3'(2'), 5'-bisphosphate nucleotidase